MGARNDQDRGLRFYPVYLVFSLIGFVSFNFNALAAPAPSAAPTTAPLSPAPVANFRLWDDSGHAFDLHHFLQVKGIVIVSQGNQFAKARDLYSYLNRWKDAPEFAGVKFILLNSDIKNDRSAVRRQSNRSKNSIPILIDDSQIVTEMLGISKYAQAVIIDPKNWQIVYRGVVDHEFDCVPAAAEGSDPSSAAGARERRQGTADGGKAGESAARLGEEGKAPSGGGMPLPTYTRLVDALKNYLSGKPALASGESPMGEGVGCAIAFRNLTAKYYNQGIKTLLVNKCGACHINQSKGAMAAGARTRPPSFKDYPSVVNSAPAITNLLLKLDPLTHHYLHSAKRLKLTSADRHNLYNWLRNGMPENEPATENTEEKPEPKKATPTGEPSGKSSTPAAPDPAP